MSNEMFTNRFGKQIPVPDIHIPKSVMTSIMRLQEDYELKGKHYKLVGVVLEVISLGVAARRNSMQYAEKTKTNKQIASYINTQLQAGLPIDREYIASLAGVQQKQHAQGLDAYTEEQVFESNVESNDIQELSDEQLESATAPNGHVA